MRRSLCGRKLEPVPTSELPLNQIVLELSQLVDALKTKTSLVEEENTYLRQENKGLTKIVLQYSPDGKICEQSTATGDSRQQKAMRPLRDIENRADNMMSPTFNRLDDLELDLQMSVIKPKKMHFDMDDSINQSPFIDLDLI